MLLRLEAEGVYVDASRWYVRVVLVWLDEIEVAAHALRETVVAIELELGGEDGVEAGVRRVKRKEEARGVGVRVGEVAGQGDARGIVGERHKLDLGVGEATAIWVKRGAGRPGGVRGIGVVEPLLAVRVSHLVGVNERITLYYPYKLLARVVEVKLDLVGDRGDRFITGELYLFDEVFVRYLGETAALISVKVDVIYVERRGFERGDSYTASLPVAIGGRAELNVDLDLVVLEGDKGEGKSGVAAEPEFKRDVEIHFWDSGGRANRGGYLGEHGDVADHVGVANLLASLLRELVPDVHPVTVVLVDALATDLDLSELDEGVAEPVEPAERFASRYRNLGYGYLEVNLVHEVTVTRYGACYTLAEVGRAVEGLFDRLHREVGVATVNNLEESNLWVTSKVNILRAVSY